MQRGHETEHRSAVGVPTDRLTEAPGGSPASALLARTATQEWPQRNDRTDAIA